MFIPSTFKRPVSSWKALNLRKTLLMASSVRLKPLNCSRLPCVYAQETLTFLLTQIGRAVQQECRDRYRMPSSACKKKATALLAYLSVMGGAHGRDLLVELLWPDTDPDRGRAALRRTLSALRGGLGQRWLTVDRSAIALEADPECIDVARFRRLVATAGRGEPAIAP